MNNHICDVCGAEAILKAYVKDGCIVCKKEIQNLCPQHWLSCNSLGDERRILKIYRKKLYKAFFK